MKDPAFGEILEGIARYDPTIISLEHPWMWPVAKAYLAAPFNRSNCKVIYSSHNHETKLMQGMLKSALPEVRDSIVSKTRELEYELLATADLTLAVSEADAADFRERSQVVVVAPNGILPPGNAGGWDYWSERYRGKKIAVFVGSAHPPNATGFMEMLGPALGYISPSQKIIVIGGVCNILERETEFLPNKGAILARADLVGVQDDGGLATLLQIADVILLPITEGGGTNIKTAEALVAGKRVLGTSLAFRGFERFAETARVSICDTPREFKARLSQLLSEPTPNFPTGIPADATPLLWHSTLSEVPLLLRSLMPPAVIELGTTTFDVHSGLELLLGRGWNVPDNWGTWSKVPDALVRFQIPETVQFPIRVSLEARAYSPLDEGVTLSVTIDDIVVFRSLRSTNQPAVLMELQIEETHLDQSRTVNLKLSASAFSSPAEHGHSGDWRRLGFGLRSISINAQPAAIRPTNPRSPTLRNRSKR